MKKTVVVCLGVLIVSAVVAGSSSTPETFALADRVGEPNAHGFFSLTTSAGSYTIRDDGMGEVTLPQGLRRVFYLKVGAPARIQRIYFLEHEGDLFLLYEVRDATSQWAYLLRMEQKKRKPRWITALPSGQVEAPTIQDEQVIIKTVEISATDGRITRQE
jgi:hypothetical protein